MTDPPSWVNITTAYRTGFETEIDLSGVAGLKTLVRGEAVSDNGTSLGWTGATDGASFFSIVDGSDTLKRAAESATPTKIAATPSPTGNGAAPVMVRTGLTLTLVAAVSVGSVLVT